MGAVVCYGFVSRVFSEMPSHAGNHPSSEPRAQASGLSFIPANPVPAIGARINRTTGRESGLAFGPRFATMLRGAGTRGFP